MTEKLTPQAGDVWVRGQEVRFVGFVGGRSVTYHSTVETREVLHVIWNDWLIGAELRFRDGKPVSPQSQGETITVECVVVRHPQCVTDQIEIHGYQDQSAAQTLKYVQEENNDYILQIATVSMNVPKPSPVPVLPAVEVKP